MHKQLTSSTDPSQPQKEGDGRLQNLSRRLKQAADSAGELAGKGIKTSEQILTKTRDATQTAVSQLQRKLGEDYYAIQNDNPLVTQTLARVELFDNDSDLLSTAYNIPWLNTLLWSSAAGAVVVLQRPLAESFGQFVHYGPGHVNSWKEINQFMDSVAGSGHRLKFGHSLEFLPQIIERFGMEGVPAYTLHILQDFTTIDGIPIVPHAWEIKNSLEIAGVSREMAKGLVSLSFSSLLGAMALITLVSELSKLTMAVSKKRRMQKYLVAAEAAQENNDFYAAITNYENALAIDSQPTILMALGQVALRRKKTRYKAHQAFEKALFSLSDQPHKTVPYFGVQLSLRGLAGIYALATADVIDEKYGDEHITDLVHATVFSFKSAADRQFGQTEDFVPDVMVTPALFSAALNYYLAARTAALYPVALEFKDVVRQNWQAARRSLSLMMQYDEEQLADKGTQLVQLWTRELLPPEEAEKVLAE